MDLQVDRNQYCSTDDVLDYIHRCDLDFDDPQEMINRAINIATAKVENYTHRDFHRHIRQEWISGENYPTCALDHYPVISILRVSIFSLDLRMYFELPADHMVNVSEDGIVGLPMLLNFFAPIFQPGLRGGIGGTFNFIQGIQNCLFVYEYGYNDVPDAVRVATAMLAAAHLLKAGEARMSQGMRSFSVQGTEVETYGHWMVLAKDWEQEAYHMLRRYRLFHIAEDIL